MSCVNTTSDPDYCSKRCSIHEFDVTCEVCWQSVSVTNGSLDVIGPYHSGCYGYPVCHCRTPHQGECLVPPNLTSIEVDSARHLYRNLRDKLSKVCEDHGHGKATIKDMMIAFKAMEDGRLELIHQQTLLDKRAYATLRSLK